MLRSGRIGMATAVALLMRKRREDELRRKAEESRAEAETRANAANQARLQSYIAHQAKLKAIEKEQQNIIEEKNNRLIQQARFISSLISTANIKKPAIWYSNVNPNNSPILGDDGKVQSSNSGSGIINQYYARYQQNNKSTGLSEINWRAFFATHPDISFPPANLKGQYSQYKDEILDLYGYNGCGAMAVCEALQNQLSNYNMTFDKCIKEISPYLNSHGFSKDFGISPSGLLNGTNEYLEELNKNLIKQGKTVHAYEIRNTDPILAIENLAKIIVAPNQEAIADFIAFNADRYNMKSKTYVYGKNMDECTEAGVSGEIQQPTPQPTQQCFNVNKIDGFRNSGLFAHFSWVRGLGYNYTDEPIIWLSETLNNKEMPITELDKVFGNHIQATIPDFVEAWNEPEIRVSPGAESIGYWVLKIEVTNAQ